MIYDLDLLAVRLKVNKYEKNKVFFVSLIHLKFYFHPLSVLFDFLPPTLSSMVALYVICLLSHIACSAPLFHLGLLLHVDKQVVFFFFFLFWNWQGYLQWNFHFGGFSKHWAWYILFEFASEWRYTDILIWIFFHQRLIDRRINARLQANEKKSVCEEVTERGAQRKFPGRWQTRKSSVKV